jgi:hypothetical protein
MPLIKEQTYATFLMIRNVIINKTVYIAFANIKIRSQYDQVMKIVLHQQHFIDSVYVKQEDIVSLSFKFVFISVH